jgi:hypothetical protein
VKPFAGFFVVLFIVCSDCFPEGEAPGPDQPTPGSPPTVSEKAKVTKTDGIFSFIQDGKKFRSLGVCVVRPFEPVPREPTRCYDVRALYKNNLESWAVETQKRLISWGVNTLGPWGHAELQKLPMLQTEVLWLGGTGKNRLMDVFEENFANTIDQQAQEALNPRRSNPWILGYFINNELPFYGDHGWPTDPNRSLLDRYMEKPPEDAGKIALIDFLLEKYPDEKSFSKDWEFAGPWNRESLLTTKRLPAMTLEARRIKNLWAGKVAEVFFRTTYDAVRRHDPDRLILGSRFAGVPPRAVLEAQAPFTDVVSINHYRIDGQPDLRMLRNIHALTKKPILIGEFSWRAQQNRSGASNSKGAEVTVPTQRDRADCLRKYAASLLPEPYLIGLFWFEYHDQPPAGRSLDGEDSNYGLVDIMDKPYEEVVTALQEVSRDLDNPRTGNLYSFDEEEWRELLPIKLFQGNLDAPKKLSLTDLNPVVVKADESANCTGHWESNANGLILVFDSKGGWGVHGDLLLPKMVNFSGAKKLQVTLVAPPGIHFRPFLTETGEAPPGAQVYQGLLGADGESYEFTSVTGTGEKTTYEFDLAQGSLRAYWGNQRGNSIIDLQSLKFLSLYVPGNQGGGQIVLSEVSFLP